MFSSFEILAGQETIGCHLLKKALDCFPRSPLYFIALLHRYTHYSQARSSCLDLLIVGSLMNQLTAASGTRIDSRACICIGCIF